VTRPKAILELCVQDKTNQLANDSRVGQTRLPGGGNGPLPRRDLLAESSLELWLTIERVDLCDKVSEYVDREQLEILTITRS